MKQQQQQPFLLFWFQQKFIPKNNEQLVSQSHSELNWIFVFYLMWWSHLFEWFEKFKMKNWLTWFYCHHHHLWSYPWCILVVYFAFYFLIVLLIESNKSEQNKTEKMTIFVNHHHSIEKWMWIFHFQQKKIEEFSSLNDYDYDEGNYNDGR